MKWLKHHNDKKKKKTRISTTRARNIIGVAGGEADRLEFEAPFHMCIARTGGHDITNNQASNCAESSSSQVYFSLSWILSPPLPPSCEIYPNPTFPPFLWDFLIFLIHRHSHKSHQSLLAPFSIHSLFDVSMYFVSSTGFIVTWGL